MFVGRCLTFVCVVCVLFVVRCLVCVGWLLFVVRRFPLLFAIVCVACHCLFFVVRCSFLVGVCYLLFVVIVCCCLLFVVCWVGCLLREGCC